MPVGKIHKSCKVTGCSRPPHTFGHCTSCWMGMSAESRRTIAWDAEFAEPEPKPLTAAQVAFERYYQETRGDIAGP